MCVRSYKRIQDGKEHTYYALVESERTPQGPRQRTGAYLGELHHDQERRWQRTVAFDNRQGDAQQLRLFADDDHVVLPDDPDRVRLRLTRVGWTKARRLGAVWWAWHLWRLLARDEIVARQVPATKHTCRPADLVAIEVINRLCAPCSAFALAEHWDASTALEDLGGSPTPRSPRIVGIGPWTVSGPPRPRSKTPCRSTCKRSSTWTTTCCCMT